MKKQLQILGNTWQLHNTPGNRHSVHLCHFSAVTVWFGWKSRFGNLKGPPRWPLRFRSVHLLKYVHEECPRFSNVRVAGGGWPWHFKEPRPHFSEISLEPEPEAMRVGPTYAADGEIRSSTGNAEATELTCTTGGRELRWGRLVGGGAGRRRMKVENGTTVIA